MSKIGRIAVCSAFMVGVFAIAGMAGAGSKRVEVEKGRFSEFSAGVDRGYNIRGPVRLKIGADWTRLRVNVKGLKPQKTYASHLHENACSDADGGGHYKDDASGPATPPNELWLSLDTNRRGNAHDASRAPWVVRNGARSVVIHNGDGARIACANLRVR
jgi:hypothetical protein